MISFDAEKEQQVQPVVSIKVIRIGGAGGNTVNSIIYSGISGIECLVVNTDAQSLKTFRAPVKIQIGVKATKGLGAGANPELGKRAAQEDLDKIMEELTSADIVFLTGGMGGGIGSGALPVVARALREQGILSIAVVTRPFSFEGKRRSKIADAAIASLKKEVDTLIIIPNQRLLDVVGKDVPMIDAFAMINDVLSQSVCSILDIITRSGHINVDFADVKAIMKDMGLAVMGTGTASGEGRATKATLQAISSPLLENMSITGAREVLLNITGGRNLGLHEISEAASIIYEQAHEDANIILGSVIDESMEDRVAVTIIATRFSHQQETISSVTVQQKIITVQQKIKEEAPLKATILDKAHANTTLTAKTAELSTNMPEQESITYITQTTPTATLATLEDLDVPTFMRTRKEHEITK